MTKPYYLVEVKGRTINKIFKTEDAALNELSKLTKSRSRNVLIYDILEMERKKLVLTKSTEASKDVLRLTEVRSNFFDESKEYSIGLGKVIATIPEWWSETPFRGLFCFNDEDAWLTLAAQELSLICTGYWADSRGVIIFVIVKKLSLVSLASFSMLTWLALVNLSLVNLP